MRSPSFSLEIFPPRRKVTVETIYDTLDGLEGLHPDFISVTYGHGVHADRAATARIAKTVCSEYGIPTVAHLTALYSDKAKIDEELELFEQAGVSSVLVLRGDVVPGQEPAGVFNHASDLAAYIHEQKPQLRLLGACYPEGHYQSTSLDEDIRYVGTKVQAGVSGLITQLFYNNEDFYRYRDMASAQGIDVPIYAGIMPVRSVAAVRRMATVNQSQITPRLERMLDKWGDNPQALRAAGIVYACEQISDLVTHGIDGIHLYTMNQPLISRRIWNNVSALFE